MQKQGELVPRLKARLGGRSKAQLIEEMVSRSPHPAATSKLVMALEVYPTLLLMLAREFPTKIWILDKGEKPSSASILTASMKQRRWNSGGITVDECEGITDLAPGYIGMVVSWRTLMVMRHEFAHAATTFIPPRMRSELTQLYQQAKAEDRFIEPLAAENLGEYFACGLSSYYFEDLRQELVEMDPRLYQVLHRFHEGTEALSKDL